MRASPSMVSIMWLQPNTKRASNSFPSKGSISTQREKSVHNYPKENDLKNSLRHEAMVLGVIQILCCLMISGLGAIWVSTSYSFSFNPEVFTMLASGYPFFGALCFATSGSLSIISGKISTKPFAMSSLTSNAMSSATAGTGIFFLVYGLVVLRTASPPCYSRKEHLSLLPYSTYKDKDCLLADVSITCILLLMFVFSVLELLLAAYASVFWWKHIYSGNTKSALSLPQSHEQI
ncbi:membrane-spanning 4-domains subfamily A member 7 [Perognathus longimembris pacificus]|uniref:membrane-spanning 4-domains subfamily A member 7 n=1 Tax=Perognathus longimembris pacificus TaxID=214514 RepID=UPI0020199B58|nr:membrane-spanning 4-domains subfamily A member 7 [Perognathus longimembris pacificus]